MFKKIFILILIFAAVIVFYKLNSIEANKGDYKIININIYKNTPVWELALAVKKQNIRSIEKIVKNTNTISDKVSTVSDKKLRLPVITTPNNFNPDWSKITIKALIPNLSLIFILEKTYKKKHD